MAKSNNLGRDLKLLLTKIVEDVTQQAFEAGIETELVGIEQMRNRITTAVTPTGSARQAGLISGPAGPSRPHAGRRETDQMYNAVTGETNRIGKDRVEITWGWQDPEAYYFYQEHGTDKIEPMEALHYSLHEAEDDLMGRLRGIK